MNTNTKRIALVTGASRGIGRAVALALPEFIIVGTATSTGGAGMISEYLNQAGIEGAGMALDVTEPGAVEALVAEIENRYGAITVLVNNAGVTRDNLVLRMKDEEWEDVMDTDLKSIFRLSKQVLKGMMKARWGRIVSITSVVGAIGNAGQANYAAAKAGIVGFSKSLAREVASRNITVNCIAPGFIDTDMTRALSQAQRDALLSVVPLGRLGLTEEIAAAARFLVSGGAAYITGSTLHVNGGMHMD
jgi:3-oxoacyl-[acyl-carrier protein] reductase